MQTPSLAPRSRGEPLLAEERRGRESGTNTKQRLPTSPRYFRDKNFVTFLALVTPRLTRQKGEGRATRDARDKTQSDVAGLRKKWVGSIFSYIILNHF